MDMSKLSPAPWEAVYSADYPAIMSGKDIAIGQMQDKDDAEFVTLARNAYAIRQSRGWYTVPIMLGDFVGGWELRGDGVGLLSDDLRAGKDELALVVNADKLYAANIEGKGP